jgi:hypothetical protein
MNGPPCAEELALRLLWDGDALVRSHVRWVKRLDGDMGGDVHMSTGVLGQFFRFLGRVCTRLD